MTKKHAQNNLICNMWITGFPIQILLHKYMAEHTKNYTFLLLTLLQI